MGRRAAKVDENQGELVEALRRMGAAVEITSSVHGGFPDVVVGLNGVSVLVEVKDGSLAPSRRRLTPAQQVVHGRFHGAITVIETLDQAVALIERMREAASRLAGIDWNMGAVANAATTTRPEQEGAHA